jgi:hypothetical protein
MAVTSAHAVVSAPSCAVNNLQSFSDDVLFVIRRRTSVVKSTEQLNTAVIILPQLIGWAAIVITLIAKCACSLLGMSVHAF